MAGIRLLLVEDNLDWAQIVKAALELTGDYEVCMATNGLDGYEAYQTFAPDVIVADVEMPEMSGLDMIRKIRMHDEEVIVIIASARTDTKNLGDGFKMDIDNYLKKPFFANELDLHIKSLFRRIQKAKGATNLESTTYQESDIYHIGRYSFEPKMRSLRLGDKQFNLTVREAGILQMLCEHNGELIERREMLRKFWKADDFYASRSLDVFIRKLRKYLEKDPSVQIQTIRGEGLKLVF